MNFRLFFVLVLISVCFAGAAYAEKDMASIYVERGVQKYLDGNIEEAITALEDALSFDKNNEKAKAVLVKILVDKGTAFYMQKSYSDANKYLEKAYKIAPDNKRVKDMYLLVKEALAPKKAATTPSVSSPSATKGSADVQAGAAATVQMPDNELMGALLGSFNKQQEKLLESFSGPNNTLHQLIVKSSEERKALMEESKEERKALFSIIAEREEALERSFDRERETVGKSFTFGIIGIISAVGIMIFFLYIVLHYIGTRREAALMQYQERMMRVMQEQTVAITQRSMDSPMLVSPDKNVDPRDMIENPNPYIRARGVELLESELGKEEDPEIAMRLLAPLLKDEDSRVVANAAKALYPYDPHAAMFRLKEMLEGPDRWTRGSALWAISIIASSDAIEILLDALSNKDIAGSIGHQVRAALIKILHSNKDMDTSLRERVETELLKKQSGVEPGIIIDEEKAEEKNKKNNKEVGDKDGKPRKGNG